MLDVIGQDPVRTVVKKPLARKGQPFQVTLTSTCPADQCVLNSKVQISDQHQAKDTLVDCGLDDAGIAQIVRHTKPLTIGAVVPGNSEA